MFHKYKSTQDQFNQEFKAMHEQMRDPDAQDARALIVKHKKHVEQSTSRYGLG